MPNMKDAAKDFLAQKSIAVVGVSRTQNKAANFIYRKLRTEGYKVFAVNPNTTTAEGDTCYPNLEALPEKPGGVVIVTNPSITELVVRDCATLGIESVWMHRGMDSKSTSVSTKAVAICHQNGVKVIPGGCPMMYCSNADIGHRFMRWLQNLTGSLPRQV